MVAREPVSQLSFEEGLRQIGLEAEWVRAAVGDGNRERTHVLGNQNAMSAQGFIRVERDTGESDTDPSGLRLGTAQPGKSPNSH